ncbi:phospholipase C [Acidipila sp. EB88]|uniref:phospholipase C n=1 Tax=Acidipila sp. EB88 TaxID=2305226 RepID=UPI000F5F9990|nr:alkaline phosphatase family protein [Acidipila sp. EB88]RRA48146.1 phosphoesterase [Acidipila sp. EB88]
MANKGWKKSCASAALLGLLQPGFLLAQSATSTTGTAGVSIAPPSSAAVQKYVITPTQEAKLTEAQKLALLQKHIKYVFVLFQENRSFDFYFGTYPGAVGLYSQPASETPGLTQPLVNTDGTIGTISAFKIPTTVTDVNGNPVPIYPQDTDSVNHAHTAYETKIDVQGGVTKNDGYAITEEGVTITNGKPSALPTLAKKQTGELVMGHVDCDAAPIMWNYADRFALFDNFHQTVLSASTPNALAMIAGQSGETQWVKHPNESTLAMGSISGNGVPVVSDGDPYWGSQLDTTGSPHQPSMAPSSTPEINLTFATLPLSFMGSQIQTTVQGDTQPDTDLSDVEKDITEIAGNGVKPTNWGWYQQGYDHEFNDTTSTASHADYIQHHNAPQYFGYISNNPDVSAHMHGLSDFAIDVFNKRLPADGGVFYVRGGYNNIQGLTPVDPNPRLATVFNGNDDHPGYSDLQISNALVADEVNLITQSPYWPESAIIITYDETDGEYDHAPEIIRSYDPYGEPLDQGPRIPTILISPYGAAHAIDHEAAEHSSIIKFIDLLYGLEPLANLPDEKQARKDGLTMFGQAYLGPADAGVSGVGNMFSAFSNNRLLGTAPALPAEYAQISPSLINTFPQGGNNGCKLLNITPTDTGRPNNVPADFNPRPSSDPGIPTSGTWTP